MSTFTVEQRLEHLQARAKALIRALRVMEERRAIIEPLLTSGELHDAIASRINGTKAPSSFNHLVPMVMSAQIGDAGRLFLDKDKNAVSLKAIHDRASTCDLYALIREEYIRIPQSFGMVWAVPTDVTLSNEDQERIKQETEDRLRREDMELYQEEFDRKWVEISQAIEDLTTCEIAKKVKEFRDKHQAHLEMARMSEGPNIYDVSSLQLTFNDVMDFQRRYVQVAIDLVLLITGTNWDLESTREHAKKSSEAMWAIFSGLEDLGSE
jgi:hypothetical protein